MDELKMGFQRNAPFLYLIPQILQSSNKYGRFNMIILSMPFGL